MVINYKISISLFLLVFFGYATSSNKVSADEILQVSINEPTKLIKTFAIADTVSSSPRIVEVDAESGKIIWEWEIPNEYLNYHNKPRPMCMGAGLTLGNDKSINALIPHFGVVNVKKNGDHKVLITDDNIDHAAQHLSDGNILYARGFVDKSVASFVIKNFNNETIWEWKPADYFQSKKDFIIPGQTCRGALRNASENERDWAHANDVGVLDNGNYILSMRNFSLFVEVKPDGKIISKYNKIQGIHQPTPYLDGYLAADRNCGEESIIVLAADGTQKKLFTGDFLLVRGIERLGGDHFLITSATTVSEISLDGKIHYKAHVKGVSSTAEIGITNTRKLSNIGSCGPKTLYQAVPTALKKQER